MRNYRVQPSHVSGCCTLDATCLFRCQSFLANRMAESLLERIDRSGRNIGFWLIDNEWSDITEDWRLDPQIAKTPGSGPGTGYPIVRNYRFVTPGHVVECEISHVGVVVRSRRPQASSYRQPTGRHPSREAERNEESSDSTSRYVARRLRRGRWLSKFPSRV
jgi:hypothetical protein